MTSEGVRQWLEQHMPPSSNTLDPRFAERTLEIKPDGSCGRCGAPWLSHQRGRVLCPSCSRHLVTGMLDKVSISMQPLGDPPAPANVISAQTRLKISRALKGNRNSRRKVAV